MEGQQNEFRGWARVEVMGHQTHIGFVTTEAYGAAVMFRVDQPAIPGGEETLSRPEWVGDTYAPTNSIVKRDDIPAATVLVGAGSIYRLVPCDEAAAMKAIRSSIRPPLILVRLADAKQITAAEVSAEQDPDDYEDEESEESEALIPGGFR
jgi:hypothetical protein